MNRTISFSLFLLFIFLSTPLWATIEVLNKADPKMDEITQLRIDKQISETMEKYKTAIDQRMTDELIEHRKYLSDMDDRLFNRLSFWIPIITATVTALFALFLWQVGRTRKEAFENAQFVATAKATEFAQQKVDSIIIPEKIIKQAEEIAANATDKLKELQLALVENVKDELKKAKDDIVKNKQDVIEQALNETVAEKFSKELDVVSRIDAIEKEFNILSDKMRIQSDELRYFYRELEKFVYEIRKGSSLYTSMNTLEKLIGFVGRAINR